MSKPKAVEEMSVKGLVQCVHTLLDMTFRDERGDARVHAAVAELARRALAGEAKTGKDGKR